MHSARDVEMDRVATTEQREFPMTAPLLLVPSLSTTVDSTLSSRRRPIERMCFICLDSGEADPQDKLIGCCTCCFAVAHSKCWADWRVAQASHARTARVSGSRLNADPFICSICKSGVARVQGERVTIRWLESFARFRSSLAHPVRIASGLFAALTGARREGMSSERAQDLDYIDDETDFFDSLEDGGVDELTLLIENVRVFVLVNVLFLSTLSITIILLVRFSSLDTSSIVMATILVLFVYIASIATFFLLRFQSLTNHRRLNMT